jgi:hypothetical protein
LLIKKVKEIGLEPIVPVFEKKKPFYASDLAATVLGA